VNKEVVHYLLSEAVEEYKCACPDKDATKLHAALGLVASGPDPLDRAVLGEVRTVVEQMLIFGEPRGLPTVRRLEAELKQAGF